MLNPLPSVKPLSMEAMARAPARHAVARAKGWGGCDGWR
jgi:hypothetical protein